MATVNVNGTEFQMTNSTAEQLRDELARLGPGSTATGASEGNGTNERQAWFRIPYEAAVLIVFDA
ncbi:hypothetical protein [Paramicrobacterium chengjingii]|uniref:Uncharacterized protein n=1 Tax=Paramicrobacterium chengjingii TaxID=2769067 RepID=A0ABX6YLK6_9MICO|nr:hypothetical protein [Microbacterium chengjingii]QPZ39688.1 hypothetical protein HCR76_06485 [Microbacterium chengjingii]